ncbi:MAG TPA: YtxH domain-containing protein [Candidatus Dojkabacteria bacterium]|nr:YtxH domain-containing protein [Candidatus Dojkabacteria bacterium]HQF36307.1 YtxH domain-containing protein [Candidatus Dojkabacteria bacterium]
MKISAQKAGFTILSVAAVSAVVGVITGILVAPKSGSETRKDLKLKASKIKEQIDTEIIPEAKKEYRKVKKAIKSEIKTLKTKGSEIINKTNSTTKKAV